MRRFNLYKRGNVYYVRFWDSKTKSYTSAISTYEREEQAAYAAVYYFEKHGVLPNRQQTVEELLTSHRLKTQIDSMNLSDTDVDHILSVLKDRNLIVAAVTPSDTESGPIPQFLSQRFDAYLEWFWSYDTSPYVARKRRHGQVHWTSTLRRTIEAHPESLA
ncbi:MAG: hypothetical protein ACOCYB_09225, partial [Alkalispirochaeta sp.]